MEGRLSPFSAYKRMERRILVERTFIKYWLTTENKRRMEMERILGMCPVEPYEILRDTFDAENEHNIFKGVFASRTSALRDAKYELGLDFVGLTNVSNALLMRDYYKDLFGKLFSMQHRLKELAFEYKRLVQIGRTHGIHAEPTSFGYRFAMVYSDVERYISDLSGMRKEMESVVFDYETLLDPSIGPDLQKFLAKDLDLFAGTDISLQISRGTYFGFISALNGLSQTLNKHTVDLNFLSTRRIGEIETSDASRSEMIKIELKAREIDGCVNEYIDLGNSINLKSWDCLKRGEELIYRVMEETIGIVEKFNRVIRNIAPDTKAIERNLSKVDESIYSQRVLHHLINNTDTDRATLLAFLREQTAKAKGGLTFKSLLSQSPYRKFLDEDVLEKLFDKNSFLVNIDDLYDRIFGSDKKTNILKKIVWNEHEIKYGIEKLSESLNMEYGETNIPVTVIAFAERSLVLAGQILLKLKFPLNFIAFPHSREDLEIEKIHCEKGAIQSKRVLIVDFLVHQKSNLEGFIKKLRDVGNPLDVKICSMLKFNNLPEGGGIVDWSVFLCEPDDFYAGYGKNCGSSEEFRHLHVIGLAS